MGAPKLDPHLREVLEDLVENGPADGFFTKMQPERIGGVFRAPDEPVSIARAGFTSLERHLVRFHREELALILRQSFLASFYTVNPKPVCQLDLPDPAELVRASRDAMQRATPGAFTYRSSHFLRRILRGEAITDPDDQISMLVASMRLEDHAHARHYYAMCCRRLGDFRSVKRTLTPLIKSTSPRSAVPALGLWRESLVALGRFEPAWNACSDAIRLALKFNMESECTSERLMLYYMSLLGLGSDSLESAQEICDLEGSEWSLLSSMLVASRDRGTISWRRPEWALEWIAGQES